MSTIADQTAKPVYFVRVEPRVPTMCPCCGQTVNRVGVHETSGVQWSWCFCLCLTVPLICCLPFCLKQCDDIRYFCLRGR
jgi:hypothetical protein